MRLNCLEFGGDGLPVLLLHGLAGRASEWRDSAIWLSESHRVFALDQRGHGASDSPDDDFSRNAYVNDAIETIEQLRMAPVTLIGQSMGGVNAFLVAARRPELVRGLVVAEASPSPDPTSRERVSRWLDSWPLPFSSRAEAQKFFGGETHYARVWAGMLDQSHDGFRPTFRKEAMLASVEDFIDHDYWEEWDRITCPVLVVAGQSGSLSRQEAARMARRVPDARGTEIPDAGHNLHLDQPHLWRATVEAFLESCSFDRV